MFGRRHMIDQQRRLIAQLIGMLGEANNAFDECTGPYAKGLVKDEPWRAYRDPSAEPVDDDWDNPLNLRRGR